jgi:pimeloyl-ACP methyl ester carboxylesterase
MKKKILIYLLIFISALLVVVSGAFLIWAGNPMEVIPEARVALQGSTAVSVEQTDWLVFRPSVMNGTALILYPGARVDIHSYAPQALQIASRGYLVVIVPMPLNMAVFDINAADAVLKAFPEVEHWAIGGHSLGGAMAAQYLATHPDEIEGLVLWASFPASNNDLSKLPVKVTSISASLDAFSTPGKIEASRSILPADTTWVMIEGGNHSQFGWYGLQPGDNPAAIPREEQTRQIVDATIALLASLGK